jgi:hypothetical protein
MPGTVRKDVVGSQVQQPDSVQRRAGRAQQHAVLWPRRREIIVSTLVASATTAHLVTGDALATTFQAPINEPVLVSGSIQARLDCSPQGATIALSGISNSLLLHSCVYRRMSLRGFCTAKSAPRLSGLPYLPLA